VNKTYIVDYGMGNLGSIANAVEAVGGIAVVSSNPSEFYGASNVVLPGVGAFGEGMRSLRHLGFIDVLLELILQKKRPLLGICLGMQMLASWSAEHGLFSGLNFIEGEVKRIEQNSHEIRIPHIGWNDVCLNNQCQITNSLDGRVSFYFVHSFCFYPKDHGHILGTCDYGGVFPAIVGHSNIFGVQFHPEKSQEAGLTVLKNFIGIT
jgi:imidazole glycerol-phosphate synthase subunit HisH